METKHGLSHPIREIKAADDGSWTVAGYISTFGNVDHQGDVVIKGAFAETLQTGNSIKFLFGHDNRSVIGVPLSLKEDDHGLFGRFRISKTSLGQDVYTLLKDGALDAFSIGYVPTDVDYDGETRLLKSVELLEASVVAIPANERALVTAVKERLEGVSPPDDEDGGEKADDEAKPYGIRKRDGMFCVVNAETGATEKCHRTRAEALAHQRALMANVPDAGKADAPGATPSDPPKGLTFDDHLTRVLAEVEGFLARAADYAGMKAADGRRQSQAHFERLRSLRAAVDGLLALESRPKGTMPDSDLGLKLELHRRRLLARQREASSGSRHEAGGEP